MFFPFHSQFCLWRDLPTCNSGPRILKEPLWNPGESNAVIVSPPIICNICASLLQMHKSMRHASCTSDDRQTAPSSCCVSLMNNTRISTAQNDSEPRRKRLSEIWPRVRRIQPVHLERERALLNSKPVRGNIMWLSVFFSQLSILFCAVTINRSCRNIKEGRGFSQQQATEQSLSTGSEYIVPLWADPSVVDSLYMRARARMWFANHQRRHCWVSITSSLTHTHAHRHTHLYSYNVASGKKKTSLKLSLFMRLQYDTLAPTAQGRKLTDPCAKQIVIVYDLLFLPRLFLPHLFSLLQILFLLLFCFIFRFVFQLFAPVFGFFAEQDCHSNSSNCWSVQRGPAMLNRYLCRHLCMCVHLQYVVKCVFLCAHLFFMATFCREFHMHWVLGGCRPFIRWAIDGNALLFLPRLPKFSWNEPHLKRQFVLCASENEGISHPPWSDCVQETWLWPGRSYQGGNLGCCE